MAEILGQVPAIQFSPWISWGDRNAFVGAGNPGVYLLAHFVEPPPGQADPLDQNIVYIGETHRQILQRRWQAFNRSAMNGRPSHAGGETYHALFNEVRADLHVAAFPVTGMEEPALTAFILYAERTALWGYVCRWNTLPDCNRE